MNNVALVGRRIDPQNAEVARFPLDHILPVRDAIRTLFQQLDTRFLVCSAACGADLLALDVANELGLSAVVVLPFEPERFRATSVTDRPGDWGPLFDRLIRAAKDRGALLITDHGGADHEGYLRATEAILEQALVLSKQAGNDLLPNSLTAVVVWEGASRGPDDLTAYFAALAQSLGIPVSCVYT